MQRFTVSQRISVFAVASLAVSGCSTVRQSIEPVIGRFAKPAPLVAKAPHSGPEKPVVEKADDAPQEVELTSHEASSNLPPEPTETGAIEPNSPAAVSASELSVADFEQLALANNPAIREISASASKAQGVQYQVGRLPNPSVGYFGSQIADAGTDQHGVFLEQQVVTGHKLRLNEEVLGQEIQAQLWSVETQRFRVLTDVRTSFFEALAVQRQVELTEAFTKKLEKGVDVEQQRLRAAEGSKPDVLLAEIQLQEMELKGQQAEFQFQGAWNTLTATAGIPHMQPTRLVGELKPTSLARDWDEVYLTLLATSPELHAIRARVCQAQANLRRQEVQPIPNLNFQLGAGVDNGTGSGMLNLQVGAPIPVFNDNSGNISAAYAEYCRYSHMVNRLEMSLKSRLGRAAQEFDSAAAAVNRYEDQILRKAEENLVLTERAREAGEFSFLHELIARRTFFEVNFQYIESLGKLAQANAKLDGLLLSGGLDPSYDSATDDGLRGQSLSQE